MTAVLPRPAPLHPVPRPATRTHPATRTAPRATSARATRTALRATTVRATTARATAWATRWATRALVTAAVLAFTVLAAGPHLLGYRTMTMLTASMSPAIDPGDVVLTTPLATTDVTEGMIISYHIPIDDHRVVTHRIVSVDTTPDGTVTVRTKGDANDAIDPWTAVLTGDTAYQVRAVIPSAGHLITTLRTPWLSTTLVYGAPTLLATWLLLTIWLPTRTQEDDQ